MHVRFTSALGMAVMGEDSSGILGTLSGIVLHPDTGKVEGFFVGISQFFASETLFLDVNDIVRWGLHITVRHSDVLSPLDERVRLQSLVAEQRPVLGQSICTESGTVVGKCADVQFETLHFMVEWIFPKGFLRWKTPIPVTQIIEVRKEHIVIRDAAIPEKDATVPTQMPILDMPGAV